MSPKKLMIGQCRIEMLGGLRAIQANQTITRFRTHKTRALLAYLAFHREHPHPRERLVETFWPAVDPDSGRLKLRLALLFLRRQLEPLGVPPGTVIAAERLTVQLNPDTITTDVAEFEAALQAAAAASTRMEQERWLMEAVQRYQGELLPGFEEPWIEPERARLAQAHQSALRQIRSLREQGGGIIDRRRS